MVFGYLLAVSMKRISIIKKQRLTLMISLRSKLKHHYKAKNGLLLQSGFNSRYSVDQNCTSRLSS
jgi:hypothetical protein